MEVARPATARADGKAVGEVRLGTGGEGGDFLMAGMDPRHVLLPPHRIGDRIEAVTDDSIDALHARGSECGDELVGDGLGHAGSPVARLRNTGLRQLVPRVTAV